MFFYTQESFVEYSRFRESMLRQLAANKQRLQRGGGQSTSGDYFGVDESRSDIPYTVTHRWSYAAIVLYDT